MGIFGLKRFGRCCPRCLPRQTLLQTYIAVGKVAGPRETAVIADFPMVDPRVTRRYFDANARSLVFCPVSLVPRKGLLLVFFFSRRTHRKILRGENAVVVGNITIAIAMVSSSFG